MSAVKRPAIKPLNIFGCTTAKTTAEISKPAFNPHRDESLCSKKPLKNNSSPAGAKITNLMKGIRSNEKWLMLNLWRIKYRELEPV